MNVGCVANWIDRERERRDRGLTERGFYQLVIVNKSVNGTISSSFPFFISLLLIAPKTIHIEHHLKFVSSHHNFFIFFIPVIF